MRSMMTFASHVQIRRIAIVLAFAAAGCVSGQMQMSPQQEDVIKSEVEMAFEGLVNATKSGDHDLYFSYFDTGTFTALTSSGSTLPSFDAFKLTYEPQLRAVEAYNSLSFEPLHIRVIDAHNAILVNEYVADVVLTSGETVSAAGAGAQFWSKRSGTWKLVHISDAVKP